MLAALKWKLSCSPLSPFLVIWFLSTGPPHHLRPQTLPSSPPPLFSCQNLAEFALFENKYGSSTGPNTKLELLRCVSSYVWPLHQHWFLSLFIPRLDSARTWSVLIVFLVLFYCRGCIIVQFHQYSVFYMWACLCYLWVCLTIWGYKGRWRLWKRYLVMAALVETTWKTEMVTTFLFNIQCSEFFEQRWNRNKGRKYKQRVPDRKATDLKIMGPNCKISFWCPVSL